jgi:hypothetical protein
MLMMETPSFFAILRMFSALDPERQVWSTGTVQETGEPGPVLPHEEKREDRDDQRKTDPFSIHEKMEHYNVYNDRTEQCESQRDADPGQEQEAADHLQNEDNVEVAGANHGTHELGGSTFPWRQWNKVKPAV